MTEKKDFSRMHFHETRRNNNFVVFLGESAQTALEITFWYGVVRINNRSGSSVTFKIDEDSVEACWSNSDKFTDSEKDYISSFRTFLEYSGEVTLYLMLKHGCTIKPLDYFDFG